LNEQHAIGLLNFVKNFAEIKNHRIFALPNAQPSGKIPKSKNKQDKDRTP
jgi:hypothetical protein